MAKRTMSVNQNAKVISAKKRSAKTHKNVFEITNLEPRLLLSADDLNIDVYSVSGGAAPAAEVAPALLVPAMKRKR